MHVMVSMSLSSDAVFVDRSQMMESAWCPHHEQDLHLDRPRQVDTLLVPAKVAPE